MIYPPCPQLLHGQINLEEALSGKLVNPVLSVRLNLSQLMTGATEHDQRRRRRRGCEEEDETKTNIERNIQNTFFVRRINPNFV